MADDPDSEAVREQLAAQFALFLDDENTIQDAHSAIQRNLDDVALNRGLDLLRRYPGKKLSFRVTPVYSSGDQGVTYMAYRFDAANRMARRIFRVANISYADEPPISSIIYKAIANDDVSVTYFDRNGQPILATPTPGEVPEETRRIRLEVEGSRLSGAFLRAADAPRKSITRLTGAGAVISGGLAVAFRNARYGQGPINNYSIFKWPVPHAVVHAYSAATDISLPLGVVFGAVAGVLGLATAYNSAIFIKKKMHARRLRRRSGAQP